jgi:CcmD family protein
MSPHELMSPFEPGGLFQGLFAAIQESTPPTVFSAAEAAARPEVVQRGMRFLMSAYSVVWLVLAAYLLTISIRLRRLGEQVRRLRERLRL